MKKNLVIVLAGGSGSRLSEDLPKQFLLLGGKEIIAHTLDVFEAHPAVHEIFIVTHAGYRERVEQIVGDGGYVKVSQVLDGGKTRQESSRIGVFAADPELYEKVLLHDAARPFVSAALISAILEKLEVYAAVNVGIPSADTIMVINDQHLMQQVPDRQTLRRVQTPQGFRLETLCLAHQLAQQNQILNATDDCSLVLRFLTTPIYVVEGSVQNIKITYPADLQIAASFLSPKEPATHRDTTEK